jgi:hypothetical protein
MTIALVKKMFEYRWHKDSARYAEIYYMPDDKGKFRFLNCNYYGVGRPYTIDDWEFLRDLALEILRLNEEGA